MDYNIEYQRQMQVVRRNDLIRESHHNLSFRELKLVLLLISKIRPEDTEFKTFVFTAPEICQIFGLSESGKNHAAIRDSIQAIADRSFWFASDGRHKLFRWLSLPEIDDNTGKIYLRLNDCMRPYLLGLKQSGNYTALMFETALCFSSKRHFALYELLDSYAYTGFYRVSVSELRERLDMGDGYPSFKEFNRRVLAPALDEIEKFTPLHVEMKAIRKGRSVDSLFFQLSRYDEDSPEARARSSARTVKLTFKNHK